MVMHQQQHWKIPQPVVSNLPLMLYMDIVTCDGTGSANGIVVIGLNHQTAPVEVRERLAFSSEDNPKVLQAMRQHEHGKNGVIIGEVVEEHPAIVTIQTNLGVKRVVNMPIAEQLPRIC